MYTCKSKVQSQRSRGIETLIIIFWEYEMQALYHPQFIDGKDKPLHVGLSPLLMGWVGMLEQDLWLRRQRAKWKLAWPVVNAAAAAAASGAWSAANKWRARDQCSQ